MSERGYPRNHWKLGCGATKKSLFLFFGNTSAGPEAKDLSRFYEPVLSSIGTHVLSGKKTGVTKPRYLFFSREDRFHQLECLGDRMRPGQGPAGNIRTRNRRLNGLEIWFECLCPSFLSVLPKIIANLNSIYNI